MAVSLYNPSFILVTVLSYLLFSCTEPKKYQSGKPFVFSTSVKVEGNLLPGEKQDLSAKLANQLDDSMRTQIVSIAGIYREVRNPPVFDSANIRRSIGYMVALLNTAGYFSPVIKDTVRRYTKVYRRHPEKTQYRVMVDFRVWPGRQLKLDSIGYALSTPELQALALQSKSQSVLKKGIPYSKQVLSAEVDRLVAIFQNHGYYKFSKGDLLIERDTVVAGLIDPTLDPFQQAALLAELRQKKENPTINVVVRQRPIRDSAHIMKYTIGKITIYPDLPVILEDTVTLSNIDTGSARGFEIISRADKFKHSILIDNVFLRPGQLYRVQDANRTLNRFNQMGAWAQAVINMAPSDSADSILDAQVKLYPSKKQNLSTDLEASRNTNDIVTASNLFGVGVNLGLRNRNAFKQSVLTSTNLRAGIELGSSFVQTKQVSASHSISIPRQVPSIPFLFHNSNRQDSLRTVIDINASYTDRHQFFQVASANASFGWQWSRNNKSFLWKPLNIEYTKLNETDSFKVFLSNIPSLNLAFRSGLIIGQQFVYKSVKQHENRTNFLTISGEESGATLGMIRSIDEGDLWRFVKAEVDYRHHIDWRRTELAFHAYAGAGWAYGREGNGFEETLPFYKAFFAGGPNSMRGWQIRQLGLGSAKFYDTATSGNGGAPLDRFGDVQLEGNVEYRFPLATVFGVQLLSAIYLDAGNIWDRHPIDTSAANKGSDFKFNRFYKEIGVDAGTGLRLKFDWIIIRFDWAYKIKDPQRLLYADRWFYDMQLFKGQFQLGINYPF